MRTIDTLSRLLRGERCPAVLHNARLDAFGSEWYGQEAIAEAFRGRPHPISDGAILLEAPSQLAMFDGDVALFADHHEGHLMRLWMLSSGQPTDSVEAAIDVPFDPDMAQARGNVFWRAEDHPDLDPALQPLLVEAGQGLANSDDYRARAFCLRAFGTAVSGAALFAVHRLGPGDVRASGWSVAAARLATGDVRIVRDLAGERAAALRPWRPRA